MVADEKEQFVPYAAQPDCCEIGATPTWTPYELYPISTAYHLWALAQIAKAALQHETSLEW